MISDWKGTFFILVLIDVLLLASFFYINFKWPAGLAPRRRAYDMGIFTYGEAVRS